MIRDNLKQVHENMEIAASRAGRSVSEITLVAVSKTKPLSDILECVNSGEHVFGENYVQEIVAKTAELAQLRGSLEGVGGQNAPKTAGEQNAPLAAESGEYLSGAGEIVFHMIGHLQTNKVKMIIDKVAMIHSVDSEHLALEIEKQAAKRDLMMDVLLEVNVAGEESKWGFTCEEMPQNLALIKKECPHLRIRGFMTSAPYTEDPESNRIHFKKLKKLFDEQRAIDPVIDTLSMGMTGDYMVAIEEGATMIRVGTGIFGKRDYAV